MDAIVAGAMSRHERANAFRDGLRWLSLSGLVALVFAAVLLAARRASAGMMTPLPFTGFVAFGAAFALAAALVRHGLVCLAVNDSRRLSRARSALLLLLPTAAVATAAISITIPGSSREAVGALSTILLVSEASSWWFATRIGKAARGRRVPVEDLQPAIADTRFDSPPPLAPQQVLADGLTQQIQRGVTDDDRDYCHGWVRTSFKEQQRTETIHLSFCPPFSTTPDFQAELVEGPDIQIKTAQVLPYGVRVEVRLAQGHKEPVETLIEFSAVEDNT